MVCKRTLMAGAPPIVFGFWRFALATPLVISRTLILSGRSELVGPKSAYDLLLLLGIAGFGFFGCSVRPLPRPPRKGAAAAVPLTCSGPRGRAQVLTLIGLSVTSAPLFAISQCSSPMVRMR